MPGSPYDKKPLGYVLDCKGVGWELSKESSGKGSLFNKVLGQIEDIILEEGFALVQTSQSSYSGNGTTTSSFDRYLNDLCTVTGYLESRFGKGLAAMGHSLGAYAVARLAMILDKDNPVFSAIALLSPPLAPKEAINMLAPLYKSSLRPAKQALAAAIVTCANAWTSMAYLDNAPAIRNGSAEEIVGSLIAAPALDELVKERDGMVCRIKTPALILYGGKDPALFPQLGWRLAREQSPGTFESRWKQAAPEANFVRYGELGHYFETGPLELLRVALPLRYRPAHIKEAGKHVVNHFISCLR